MKNQNKLEKIRKNTFLNSPSLRWFEHWVGEDGMVDAIDVNIYWNEIVSPTVRIEDVVVVYNPIKKLSELGYEDHPLWHVKRGFLKDRRSTLGNCCDTWMKKDDVRALGVLEEPFQTDVTPTALFEYFRSEGFEVYQEAEQAVNEFKFIRECEWARDPNLDINAFVKPYTEEDYRLQKEMQILHKVRRKEKESRLKKFAEIVNNKLNSGEMVMPNNIDININYAYLGGYLEEANPGALEFKKQYEAIVDDVFEGFEDRVSETFAEELKK